MTKIAIFLEAEAAALPPQQRLVVPQAAGIEAKIAADRSHVAQHRRSDRPYGLVQDGEIFANERRMFDGTKACQRPNFDALARPTVNSPQFADAAQVENVWRREQFLLHRRQQVGTARNHFHLAVILRHQRHGFIKSLGAQQLEAGQAHSPPPAVGPAFVPCRAGSSGCRIGPLPRNHSEPPCSRSLWGAVGSTNPVISTLFIPFFARSAASTRSGVNGASRRRTPTAS